MTGTYGSGRKGDALLTDPKDRRAGSPASLNKGYNHNQQFLAIFSLNAKEILEKGPVSLPDILENIRLDLMSLFNTACQPEALLDEYHYIKKSVYCYGMPNLSVYDPRSSNDRYRICEIVKNLIDNFEQRLSNVSVYIEKNDYDYEMDLKFNIEADLVLANQDSRVIIRSSMNRSEISVATPVLGVAYA